MIHYFPLTDGKHELCAQFQGVPPTALLIWIRLTGEHHMSGADSHRTIHFDFTPRDDDALRAIQDSVIIWLNDPTHRPVIEGPGFSIMTRFAHDLRRVAAVTHSNYIAHHFELRKKTSDEPEEDWALISRFAVPGLEPGIQPATLCRPSDTEQLSILDLIRWGYFRATRSTAEAVCRWWNAGHLEHGLQMIAQQRINDFLAGRRSLSTTVATASK